MCANTGQRNREHQTKHAKREQAPLNSSRTGPTPVRGAEVLRPRQPQRNLDHGTCTQVHGFAWGQVRRLMPAPAKGQPGRGREKRKGLEPQSWGCVRREKGWDSGDGDGQAGHRGLLTTTNDSGTRHGPTTATECGSNGPTSKEKRRPSRSRPLPPELSAQQLEERGLTRRPGHDGRKRMGRG